MVNDRGISVAGPGGATKVAVTVVAADMVTVQEPVPVQPPPLQPVKEEPVGGVQVRAPAVSLGQLAAPLVPHVIPAGTLVTVPLPVPAFVTVRTIADTSQ